MTGEPELRRSVLALCGHRAHEAAGAAPAEWSPMAAMIRAHRLGPALYGRWKRGRLSFAPAEIVAGWQQAYRANAVAHLARRRALAQALAALAPVGIAPMALKGMALAGTAWPDPAERAMRDIDLLVPPARLVEAYAALRAARWTGPDPAPAMLADIAARETHAPPLTSPDGVDCELHARLWARPPVGAVRLAGPDSEVFLSRAVPGGAAGVAVPEAADMLLHLCGHAARVHLMNAGPLPLLDIDRAITAAAPDWAEFRTRAAACGMTRTAALMLGLTERWRRPGLVARAGLAPPPPAVLDEAELLMLQDPGVRADINLATALVRGAWRGRLAAHPLDAAEGGAPPRYRRALGLMKSLSRAAVRRDAAATARLDRWLAGPD